MPAPGQFVPRNSSAHRIACISLYRALLKQCPLIPIPDDIPLRGKTNPIEHFVKKQFRKNVWHTSSKMIVGCLETGYAVHSLLHHAASSPANIPNASLLQIHTLLRTLSKSYQTSVAACPPKPLSASKICRVAPYPNAPRAIDIRPLPKEKLTGRRQIPKLVAVHGIFPFMRFKKPQSPFLSGVLNQKIEKKARCFKVLEEMEEGIMLGEWEERWEKDVWDIQGEGRERLPGGRWWREAEKAKQGTWDVVHEDGRRSLALGEQMRGIIEEEKRLYEEERKERKRLKNQERWDRKRRKEGETEIPSPPPVDFV